MFKKKGDSVTRRHRGRVRQKRHAAKQLRQLGQRLITAALAEKGIR